MEVPNEFIPPTPPTRQAPAPVVVLLLLAALSLLGVVLGSALAFGWGQMQGVNLQTAIYSLNEQSERSLRDVIRMANLLNHIVTFTFPALLVALVLYKRDWIAFLKLQHFPKLSILTVGVIFVIAAFPFVQITYWLNHQLPLPEWMREMEKTTSDMVKALLVMDSPAELLFNLLIIAVIPAIGEELIFRGILQQQLQRVLRNPVAAIWLAAILFSAIHMQFVGFLPRMVLGAALGYIFYWTRSLWMPIIAHFMMNALQVVGQYVTEGKLTENELTELKTAQWIAGFVSLLITCALGYYLWKKSKEKTLEEKLD
ncbi:MAG: lysostaphin resistance A-like protein [Saprospiraceae bacterium]